NYPCPPHDVWSLRSMPRFLSRTICLAACFTLTLAAQPERLRGAELFVNNLAGDDRYNGSAAEFISQGIGPFRTIRRAMRAAQPGDRIILAANDEPYRESISLNGRRHSGTPGH